MAMTPRVALAAALSVGLVAGSPAAWADDGEQPRSPHSVGYQSLFTGRLNPLGLIERLQLFYRYRLYESDSAALEQNHLGFEVVPTVSPAFASIGGAFEVQPLSILALRAQYDAFGYFGTFDLMQSFATDTAAWDDDTLDTLGTSYATTGTQLTLGALLQLKVGPIAGRANLRAVYSDFDLRAGDGFFYDIVYDLLAEDEAWFFSNDADLIWLSEGGLIVGARHTITWSGAPGPSNQRLGPLVAYRFFDREGPTRFDRPTVLLVTGWYLEHRYRAGQETSRALPYLVLGFAFDGVFL
jgi:hypothetical protein